MIVVRCEIFLEDSGSLWDFWNVVGGCVYGVCGLFVGGRVLWVVVGWFGWIVDGSEQFNKARSKISS